MSAFFQRFIVFLSITFFFSNCVDDNKEVTFTEDNPRLVNNYEVELPLVCSGTLEVYVDSTEYDYTFGYHDGLLTQNAYHSYYIIINYSFIEENHNWKHEEGLYVVKNVNVEIDDQSMIFTPDIPNIDTYEICSIYSK